MGGAEKARKEQGGEDSTNEGKGFHEAQREAPPPRLSRSAARNWEVDSQDSWAVAERAVTQEVEFPLPPQSFSFFLASLSTRIFLRRWFVASLACSMESLLANFPLQTPQSPHQQPVDLGCSALLQKSDEYYSLRTMLVISKMVLEAAFAPSSAGAYLPLPADFLLLRLRLRAGAASAKGRLGSAWRARGNEAIELGRGDGRDL